jgi:hypothetical protein
MPLLEFGEFVGAEDLPPLLYLNNIRQSNKICRFDYTYSSIIYNAMIYD